MPDRRRHRGPHPKDPDLFAPRWHDTLRTATSELSWLLTRGYAPVASLKLVGDRYQLARRQRQAVHACSASDAQRADRRARRLPLDALDGREITIDGFNCLITVEAALSGGLVLLGRDGAHRDLSGVRGSYRKIEETLGALSLLGELLAAAGARSIEWCFDRPVSNSGRLRALMLAEAEARGWPWRVRLTDGTDREVVAGPDVVASSDGWILDQGAPWVDLAGAALSAPPLAGAWVLELGGG